MFMPRWFTCHHRDPSLTLWALSGLDHPITPPLRHFARNGDICVNKGAMTNPRVHPSRAPVALPLTSDARFGIIRGSRIRRLALPARFDCRVDDPNQETRPL